MVYSLTVDGYTFKNPPEEYRKLIRLSNNPQPSIDKEATDFYQSGSQDIQFSCEGTLALDPALGGTDDLDELERLQKIAITGGEVTVQFDPFFSGKCVIEDDPFRQSESESDYSFTFTVNEETTSDSAYPARNPPDTGNTFKLGSLDLGYDPDTVSQNYERNTEETKRLQGLVRSVDTAGLITTVRLSGMIDGEGQAELWQKARNNVLAYLSAEFQKGWCLIDSLSIRNQPEAPDYLEGLFQYELSVYIVKDPASGIGDVSSYVDQEVKRTGTYTGDPDDGESSFDGQEFTVKRGTGSLDGNYLEWGTTTVTLSDNDTNYSYVDDQDGDGYGEVKVNQSAFPADALPFYRVEVSNGTVQKVVDVRAILLKDRKSEEGGNDGGDSENGDPYITVKGGDYEIASGTVSKWNTTKLLLESNTRNYVWIEDSQPNGTAQVNTNASAYPTSGNFVEMYRVDTDSESVTNIIDDRPPDISEEDSDTGDADLTLQDGFSLDDSEFDFERFLRFSDSISMSGNAKWQGILSVTDSLSISESGLIPAVGSTSFTDSITVKDGGSSQQANKLTTTITLNGESVDATVYEDTDNDGTAENQQTITLSDGSSQTVINGFSGSTSSDYWIRFDLSTTDSSVTPTVEKASLDVGGSGVDEDQNPNTEWTVYGAKYDSSGNEYEGGGMVSVYDR